MHVAIRTHIYTTHIHHIPAKYPGFSRNSGQPPGIPDFEEKYHVSYRNGELCEDFLSYSVAVQSNQGAAAGVDRD